LRRGLQQFLQRLPEEFGAAGGEVAAGLGARRNKIELAVLHLLECARSDAGFRRIALVVGGIDRQQRRFDLAEAGRAASGFIVIFIGVSPSALFAPLAVRLHQGNR